VRSAGSGGLMYARGKSPTFNHELFKDIIEYNLTGTPTTKDVDELLKDHSFFPKKLAYNLEIWSVEKENTQSRGEEDII
jgi:glutamate synthase domain-containing protein 3